MDSARSRSPRRRHPGPYRKRVEEILEEEADERDLKLGLATTGQDDAWGLPPTEQDAEPTITGDQSGMDDATKWNSATKWNNATHWNDATQWKDATEGSDWQGGWKSGWSSKEDGWSWKDSAWRQEWKETWRWNWGEDKWEKRGTGDGWWGDKERWREGWVDYGATEMDDAAAEDQAVRNDATAADAEETSQIKRPCLRDDAASSNAIDEMCEQFAKQQMA